jgi:hypothetical protein
MYHDHGAIEHVDVSAGSVLYRVFLLPSSLQVDLSFWAYEDFAGTGEPFDLVFGQSNPEGSLDAPDVAVLAGMGWLYALHVRSSLARGKTWQAMSMLDGFRDRALAVACLEHGLRTSQARDLDLLPREVLAAFTASLVSRPDPAELARAFRSTAELFLEHVRSLDEELADRLVAPLNELVRTAAR